MSDTKIWDDPQKAQEINKEKVYLEKELVKFNNLDVAIKDSIELAEIAIEEDDSSALEEISKEIENNDCLLYTSPSPRDS